MSKRNKDEIADLKDRVATLEQRLESVAWLWQNSDSEDTNPATSNRSVTEPAVEKILKDLLPALGGLAASRDERLLIVAHAGPHGAEGGNPLSVTSLANEESVRSLAGLGSAIGHISRVKMLQALLTQQECTTTVLAEVSGASGGNLYQHLNELDTAKLVFQPSRGHYRLTPTGESAVALLFYLIRMTQGQVTQRHWQADKPTKLDRVDKIEA